MALPTVTGGLAFVVGRLLYGAILGFMGLNHFMDLDEMSGYAESKGVPAPRLAIVVSGLFLILGGLAVILGVYPRVGAGLIAVFFIGVTPVMHDFWAVDDPEQRQAEMTNFLKNAALFGGALVLFDIGATAWPYALNLGL